MFVFRSLRRAHFTRTQFHPISLSTTSTPLRSFLTPSTTPSSVVLSPTNQTNQFSSTTSSCSSCASISTIKSTFSSSNAMHTPRTHPFSTEATFNPNEEEEEDLEEMEEMEEMEEIKEGEMFSDDSTITTDTIQYISPNAINSQEEREAAAVNMMESLTRLTSPSNMSRKGRLKLEVREITTQFGGDEFNSGRTEVQIAIMTKKIAHLSSALKHQKKDKHNIRNLELMISKRRKNLKYLIRQDRDRYYKCVNALGLRDVYGDKVVKRKGARRRYPPAVITDSQYL